MSVTVVRYQTRPDRAEENQALVEEVFAELHVSQPEGLIYTTYRLADGVSFVHVAEVDTADGHNPLTAAAAFDSFLEGIADRCAEGPDASSATVVGRYRPTTRADGHRGERAADLGACTAG